MNSGAGPFLKPKVALWPGGEGGLSIVPAMAGFPKAPEVVLWPVDLWMLIRYTTHATNPYHKEVNEDSQVSP
jgi:hypothetical protein